MAIVPPSEEIGKSRDKAAEAVGVSARYVQDAKKVAAKSPGQNQRKSIASKPYPYWV